MLNLSAFFHPSLAGPLCSGLWCVPLGIYYWLEFVAPVGLLLFGLIMGGWWLVRRHWPRYWVMAIIVVPCLVVGHIGFFWFNQWYATDAYQQTRTALAQHLSFDLYQPSYTVPGFELVEDTVYEDDLVTPGGQLVFEYYDRSTQDAPDVMPRRYYQVVVQRTGAAVKPKSADDQVLASRTTEGTTVFVAGHEVSQDQANQVLASLQPVAADQITFRSQWAGLH
jgi:hypothetical protein